MVDMVEQDVSRVTKYRGAVTINPPTEEHTDELLAELGEELVEAKFDEQNIDEITPRHRRRVRIFGVSYAACLWDENLGPLHKDYVAEVFERAGIEEDPEQLSDDEIEDIFINKIKEIPKLSVKDKNGKPVKDADGKPLKIDRPVRLGDVYYKLLMPWKVLPQIKEEWEDVEYLFWWEIEHVESVQADHADKAHEVKSDPDELFYDSQTMEEMRRPGHVKVIHFWHRSTKRLGQGRYIKFTKDAILENGPNPHRGPNGTRRIPLRRSIDIDVPGSVHPDSTVTHGRPMQAIINNVYSTRVRNQYLFSRPKWAYPKGTISVQGLANDATLLAYKGPVSPKLLQASPTGAETVNLGKDAKEDYQQIMGVFGVSRGEPPTGVTAAVALTFLDEQENERANPAIADHTAFIRGMAEDTLFDMATFYDDSDGRLEKLLGRHRASQIENFRMADLSRLKNLKIQNASALPQQKSARTQYILDIKERFPNAVEDDLAIDLLGLGQEKKLRNLITVSIRAADEENENIFRTGKTAPPERWEMHLVHYRSHLREMQDPSFHRAPEAARAAMESHVMATEMLMWEITMKSQEYAARIFAEFPQFPVFFVPETVDVLPPGAAPPPGGPEGLPEQAAGMGAPAGPEGLPPEEIPPAFGEEMAPGEGLETPLPEAMGPGESGEF
jgi:hypothetical protein